MTSTHGIAGRIVAWTAAATIGIGAVAGIAYAATDTAPTASAPPTAASSPHAKTGHAGKGDRIRALARRTVHGEFVVKGKDGKYVTAETQRGAVTAVSRTSITVRSADGFTATYAVTSDTKVGKDKAKADIAAVKVGDLVLVVAVKADGGKTARGLLVAPGKQD
ncbi:MAG: hypothetical protein ABJA34_05670 [Pseudonocardiales bacterium]